MARVRVFGYLSIDAIESGGVRSDGVSGGGALYAALGARQAGAEAVIHAAVGEDYPPAWILAMAEAGIDTSHIEYRPGPTRRARLSYDTDGGRGSPHHGEALWRERSAALVPKPCSDPADAVAICPMPLGAAEAILAGTSGIVVADISEAFAVADPDGWRGFAARVAVFAPSREETRILCPGLSDDDALVILATGGDVVQKLGADGLAVSRRAGTETALLPARSVPVVDPTGAGDATVGAIAARLALGDDLVEACREAIAIGALAVGAVGPRGLGFAPGAAEV